ncbi:MAG: DUF1552 domain-containing protein [Planctomycetes bacterium]|nr:DUF1552 domain-containing protein [Planctomycetota bacterium]
MTQALDRRTFLKGLGTTMALPLLDAMLPSTVFAAGTPSGRPPVRMAFVFFPNGAIMPAWKPNGVGKDFEFSETLQLLAKFRDDINVISGLAQDNGRAKGDGPGDHARSAASFLTGAHPVKTSGADIRVGISADQLAAEQIGQQTRLPSLELGIEPGRNAGSCDSGYSCAYSNAISWKTPSTPMAKEIHPRLVFERLFGNGDADHQAVRRKLYRKSILDLVADDANRLKSELGETDRRKIDEYFTGVRELELRIAKAEREAAEKKPDFEVPHKPPREMQEHIRLMYDLLVLAFRSDATRIATFMVGNEGSNRPYPMVGVNAGWHELSHHQGAEEKIAKIKKIDLFHVEQFAYFLEKLKAVKEGEGTLLDNCMVLYGSGLSDGNRHDHHNLPVVLAGRAGGSIVPGRHIQVGRETPMNNLFLSMVERVGAQASSFGDSTGTLKELEG